MEKRRPTYDLETIKLAIGSLDTLAVTIFQADVITAFTVMSFKEK